MAIGTARLLNWIRKSDIDVRPIDWCGLHREYLIDGEMEVIAALVRDVGAQTMVEIGCRDGRTARVLLANVPTLVRYVGIDVPASYVPALYHQRFETVAFPGHLAESDPRFELKIRDYGSLDLLPMDLPRCDAVFIDGDHSEIAVFRDSHLAASIVRPGGIVIWHDATNAQVEVRSALDRLTADGWTINAIEGTWLAFCIGSD